MARGGGRLAAESSLAMEHADDPDMTELLQAWGRGDLKARDDLLPLVYRDLQRRAEAYMQRERAGHTLQATALVHEAFLRLIKQNRIAWQNRAQFFGVAAAMMRRILVDRARARRMVKRSGRWVRVTMDDAMAHGGPHDVDVIDLDAALTELARVDARKSQIAEQRFLAASRSRKPGGYSACRWRRWSGSGRRRAPGSTLGSRDD